MKYRFRTCDVFTGIRYGGESVMVCAGTIEVG